ncbi:MAG: S-formylglutathione hydrolase [Pseudomonadota bacterium]
METVSTARAHGGTQSVHKHHSTACKCEMTFSIFLPPQAEGGPVPLIWYLSGLTCTHANVMDKGEYRAHAAQHGVAIVCPDTSPRNKESGDGVANDESWQLGMGAGFYVNATQQPWADHYQMYSYVTEELPALVAQHFPLDMRRQSVFGHSMGGHGALICALNNPEKYRACSAFAPIVNPSTADWSRDALNAYLGEDEAAWARYDATRLVQNGVRFDNFLIDQGDADGFLDEGLRPWLFEEACKKADQRLTLRMQPGYDHSYNFISTFMGDHIKWHAERLKS